MHRIAMAMLLLTALLGSGASVTAQADTAAVAARVQASVVTVYTWDDDAPFVPGRNAAAPTGAGSGWAWADGVIVTNAHVVAGAERIEVVTAQRDRIAASLVGSDWYQDVAVLHIDVDVPPLPVGDSADVAIGDAVIAIGTPHGQFANTATTGTVLGTGVTLNTGQGYSLLNLVQHDAAIQRGNSGGPLLSMDGAVIGMNVARADLPATEGGVSFAIDGNTVVELVEEIMSTGAIARPWLGVTAELTADGTVAAAIEEGSPAAEAGVRPGDGLLAVDGEAVSVAEPFIDLLYRHAPGETVTLTLDRDGERLEVEVRLDQRAPAV